MKKQKQTEQTVPISKYTHEVDSIRMSWSNDVKMMMKLWDSHQRLINLLESIVKTYEPGVLLGDDLRSRITNEIQRAKEVKV